MNKEIFVCYLDFAYMDQFPDEPRKYIRMVSAHFFYKLDRWTGLFYYAPSARPSVGASSLASVCPSPMEIFLVNGYTSATKPQAHI